MNALARFLMRQRFRRLRPYAWRLLSWAWWLVHIPERQAQFEREMVDGIEGYMNETNKELAAALSAQNRHVERALQEVVRNS